MIVLLAGGAVVWACNDDCMNIQNQLCLCQGQTVDEQNTCQFNASTQEGNNNPSSQVISHCTALLPGCTALIDGGTGCHLLQTEQGRQICGLSPLPDGG